MSSPETGPIASTESAGVSATIRVEILAFARVREICGAGRLTLDVPRASTAADCLSLLEAEYPELASLRGRLLPAINEGYTNWSDALADGDRLALIPPVSGG
jgi:molybdopterin synthase catalytic subunit